MNTTDYEYEKYFGRKITTNPIIKMMLECDPLLCAPHADYVNKSKPNDEIKRTRKNSSRSQKS